MEDILKFELSSNDPAEINKFLDQYLEALDRSLAEMAKTRERIDRTNAENQAALAHLRELMRKAA
jgi:hypothetical protein